MLKTVKDAIRIDELNGNDFWRTYIEKELKTICVAYKPYAKNNDSFTQEEIRADQKKHMVGYKEITCHFKLNGSFTRKA